MVDYSLAQAYNCLFEYRARDGSFLFGGTMDKVKEDKFNNMNMELFNYRKYMCARCDFYIDEVCTKKRIVSKCAKKGLRNKA